MNTTIDTLDRVECKRVLGDNKNIPAFRAGDSLRVSVRVTEGSRERLQAFEGVCIARRNGGLHGSFRVRKISSGTGVERSFPLYSPRISKIEVVRFGDVSRAKLYYLKGLTGKSARIPEKKRARKSQSQKKEEQKK